MRGKGLSKMKRDYRCRRRGLIRFAASDSKFGRRGSIEDSGFGQSRGESGANETTDGRGRSVRSRIADHFGNLIRAIRGEGETNSDGQTQTAQ